MKQDHDAAPLRHLLLISHFFPPMGGGGVQRVTKFVKYLERYGWRTTVIAGRPEDYWMQDDSLLEDVPQSAQVIRTAAASGLGFLRRFRPRDTTSRRSSRGYGWMRRLGSWFLIPDTYIGWLPFALAAARKALAEDPAEVLLSSGPPETNHLVALRLKAETQLPWLADFRDPWFGLHLHQAPTAWHRHRHAQLEGRVLEAADCVVATTSWLRDLLRDRAPNELRRPYVIRNGYDPEDFPTETGAAVADELQQAHAAATPASGATRPLRLVHTGMLTLTRSVQGLLQGLSLLVERRPELRGRIRIELIGARESHNDELVERMGLRDSVRFQDYVAHHEAIAAMRAADVLILVKHTEERFRGLIPGKFYEYLGARRPILALVPESEAADLVRTLGCGEIAAPDAPDAIATALERLWSSWQAGTLQEQYCCESRTQFGRPEQAENLAALLEQIAPRRAGASL